MSSTSSTLPMQETDKSEPLSALETVHNPLSILTTLSTQFKDFGRTYRRAVTEQTQNSLDQTLYFISQRLEKEFEGWNTDKNRLLALQSLRESQKGYENDLKGRNDFSQEEVEDDIARLRRLMGPWEGVGTEGEPAVDPLSSIKEYHTLLRWARPGHFRSMDGMTSKEMPEGPLPLFQAYSNAEHLISLIVYSFIEKHGGFIPEKSQSSLLTLVNNVKAMRMCPESSRVFMDEAKEVLTQCSKRILEEFETTNDDEPIKVRPWVSVPGTYGAGKPREEWEKYELERVVTSLGDLMTLMEVYTEPLDWWSGEKAETRTALATVAAILARATTESETRSFGPYYRDEFKKIVQRRQEDTKVGGGGAERGGEEEGHTVSTIVARLGHLFGRRPDGS